MYVSFSLVLSLGMSLTHISAGKLDNAKDLGLGKYPATGGSFWKDCMIWTVVAASDEHSPPDTLDGHSDIVI